MKERDIREGERERQREIERDRERERERERGKVSKETLRIKNWSVPFIDHNAKCFGLVFPDVNIYKNHHHHQQSINVLTGNNKKVKQIIMSSDYERNRTM